MLAVKYKENLKTAFISSGHRVWRQLRSMACATSQRPCSRARSREMLAHLSWLILTLTLLVKPILAEQQRNSSKSRPQRQTASTTRQSSKPSLANKTPSNIAAMVRSSMPRISVNSSIRRGSTTARSNITRIAKPNTSIRQPNGALSSRLKRGRTITTLNRTPVLQQQGSVGTLRRSIGRTPTIQLRYRASSTIGKRTTISLGNKISSGKTSHIRRLIVATRPSAVTTAKPSSTSIDSRTITNKTSRIGELIGKQRPSPQIVMRSPAKSQRNDTNLRNRTHLGDSSLRSASPKRKAPGRSRISSIRTSRITSPITKQSRSVSTSRHSRSSGLLETLRAISRKPVVRPGGSRQAEKRAEAGRTRKGINLRVVDRLRTGSREGKSAQKRQKNTAHGNSNPPLVDHGGPSKGYREHPPVVRNKHRYEHIYWDYHNQLRHRIIWPRYRFTVCYRHGPRFALRYVYPYYLRRYIFISLSGYWPLDYSYIRYYWYGCHPYSWYGYYPIAREVTGDTYNYYTYNYYNGDGGTVPSASAQVIDGIKPVDHNTFADVREKIAQQAEQEPAPKTAADIYFDEAVKAFEAGSYETAVEKFTEAKALAADDMVLPFAYSQALFANKQYAEAAEILRTALEKVSPEKEGVFYPRGLYSDDEILFEQIEHLNQKAELYYFDADLQLLLGYHLLGIGEIDKAVEPLESASQDIENAAAATVLLDLLAKISTDTKVDNND
jgi:hypothetical protein